MDGPADSCHDVPVSQLGWTALVLFLAASLPPPASAQDGFAVDRFNPMPNPEANYLSAVSGRLPRPGRLSVGLLFGHTDEPLVLSDPGGVQAGYSPVVGRVVTSQTVLHLMAGYGVFDWLEIGLDLPMILGQQGEALSGLDDPKAVEGSFGLGDLRLLPKLGLFDTGTPADPRGVSMSILVDAALPTGRRSAFQGGGLRLTPKAAVEWQTPWYLRVAGNIGYTWREAGTTVLGAEVESAPTWAIALELPVLEKMSVLDRVSVVAEVFQDVSIESLFAARVRAFGVELMIGAGAGLSDTDETPDWRLVASLGFSRALLDDDDEPRDQDADGIVDADDRCPTAPEDPDGFEDEDGCPDLDDDGDGVEDTKDRCPRLPEDPDGFQDEDGCPDPDNDEDGITDAFDRCKDEPEDRDGFEDGDGCPEEDNDRDGIADAKDACPLDPEDLDMDQDDDGCPDFDASFAIDVVINFETDSSAIDPDDQYELDRVAQTIVAAPPSLHVWIEGHADDTGSSAHNRRLSQSRCDAVRNYLISRGVPASRLSTRAWGETYNVRANESEAGKLTNRRVEFNIAPRLVGNEPLEMPKTKSSTVSR